MQIPHSPLKFSGCHNANDKHLLLHNFLGPHKVSDGGKVNESSPTHQWKSQEESTETRATDGTAANTISRNASRETKSLGTELREVLEEQLKIEPNLNQDRGNTFPHVRCMMMHITDLTRNNSHRVDHRTRGQKFVSTVFKQPGCCQLGDWSNAQLIKTTTMLCFDVVLQHSVSLQHHERTH